MHQNLLNGSATAALRHSDCQTMNFIQSWPEEERLGQVQGSSLQRVGSVAKRACWDLILQRYLVAFLQSQ